MKLSPQTSPKARLAGLSLVGWLGLIVVIAVLMALFFPLPPPGWGVHEGGRKAEAHNDEMQIITAVKAYVVEYGKLPIDPSKTHGPVIFSEDNNLLFDVLRNRNGAKIGNPLNPRGIVFLDIVPAHDQNHPREGVETSTGVWYDPWGSPYHIAIDGDQGIQLNGKVPLPDFYSDVGTLPLGVIAWSYGKNGELGGGPATKSGFSNESGTSGKYEGSGDVLSWQ